MLVNSFHHQAVATPGAGVRIVATAPDGVCEALRAGPRALGVQWHPEYLREQPEPVVLVAGRGGPRSRTPIVEAPIHVAAALSGARADRARRAPPGPARARHGWRVGHRPRDRGAPGRRGRDVAVPRRRRRQRGPDRRDDRRLRDRRHRRRALARLAGRGGRGDARGLRRPRLPRQRRGDRHDGGLRRCHRGRVGPGHRHQPQGLFPGRQGRGGRAAREPRPPQS